MNKKIMSLFVCLVLGVTMASAVSVENANAEYNVKTKTLTVSYDEVLDNECSMLKIRVLDKQGRIVGKYGYGGIAICSISQNGNILIDFRRTGTFEAEHELDISKKSNKLTYEIYRFNGVFAEGKVVKVK